MDIYKQYPSGLRLVAKYIDSYTVSLGVFVNVGSVREDASNNGYSHFIEHLVFKGTKKRSCLQISEEIDDIGANINAYTSKDSTCFYTKSVSCDLEKCLDILSDMYFNASIPEDELEREKGVVIEEIKMCEDTPDDVSQDLVSQALFFKQPLGQTILGTAENINNSDRHSILSYKNTHYTPKATVVAVCGKFDADILDKLVERYFENNCLQGTSQVVDEPSVEYCSKFLYKFKPIEQSHLQIAWGGFPLASHKRYIANLLASVLGGGMSSRLNQAIREKHGLAYSVYSYPSFYSNCGTFEIYMGLSPENCAKACNLVKDEICRLMQSGVTAKELDRVKAQAVNSLYMNVESNLTLMRLYGRSVLKLNELFNVEKDAEHYRAVTAEDIQSLACDLLDGSYASAYVGPKTKDFIAVSQIDFS